MFNHQPEESFSPTLFLMQLVFAPLGTLVIGLVSSILLESLVGVKNNVPIGYICFCLEGFLFGYIFQTGTARAYRSGGAWVWLPPLCLLAWGFLDELSRRPATAIQDFFVGRAGSSASAYALVLFTLPAIGSCLYSIGVVAGSRPANTSLGKLLRKIIVNETSANGSAG